MPFDGVRTACGRRLGLPVMTPAILSALFDRETRPRFGFKVVARLAQHPPIPLPIADVSHGAGRVMSDDEKAQHTLAMLPLAPRPAPARGGSWGRNPLRATGRHRALRASFCF